MSARLIVNSDDYGHTAEVSRGVREAHLRGVVTSTTCMMNHATAAADIRLAVKQAPRLGLGVHLVLTSERPILPPRRVPTLTDDQGTFLRLNAFTARLAQINVDEVRAEWRAQIEAFIHAAGRNPTHLDSHHHSSYFSAGLLRVMLELAREYQCAIRSPLTYDEANGPAPDPAAAPRAFVPELLAEFDPRRPRALFVSFYDQGATLAELLRIIGLIEAGTYEIMCHPGYVDAGLLASSSYNQPRERELQILTDPSVRRALAARGIELISFQEL